MHTLTSKMLVLSPVSRSSWKICVLAARHLGITLNCRLHSREQSCMRGPSPLLLRWLSASPAAGNEAWNQGLLKCQQHQNHLTRGKPDCQAPPRVSVVSEIWAPENMHLLQVLNDMTMVLGHSPHFKDHSFEDSILPFSPDS